MKRTLMLCSLVMMPAMWLAAQDATITAPVERNRWIAGTPKTITWTHRGDDILVKLLLWRRSSGRVGVIQNRVHLHDDLLAWEAGRLNDGTMAPGAEDYSIRILRQSDNSLLDESGQFTIGIPVLELTNFTAPGETYTHRSTQIIRWTFNVHADERLQLKLYKDGTDESHCLGIIAQNVNPGGNDFRGRYDWKVGDYVGGTAGFGNRCFYLKLATMSGTASDVSGSPFSITPDIRAVIPLQTAE